MKFEIYHCPHTSDNYVIRQDLDAEAVYQFFRDRNFPLLQDRRELERLVHDELILRHNYLVRAKAY